MATRSRLTVVTGPERVDIGAAVATIGGHLDDGLAVRVIDSLTDGNDRAAHTSPDPHHCRVDGAPGAVRLRYLPSAWQNPDTNLAVVYTGWAHASMMDDIHTMAALGLDPSHRLTVQALSGPLRRDYTYPAPIEPGDVGVHARDAVLRAGGNVLIEAGGGMTHLEALAALRIAPWAPWIGALDLWTVFDARNIAIAMSPGEHVDADMIAARVADGLTQLGALIADAAHGVTSRVVVLGLDDPATLPGVDKTVGSKVIARVGTGVDMVRVGLRPSAVPA